MENNINNLSPLTLAFLGDAVYGLLARKRLVLEANRPADKLHKLSVKTVNAAAQANAAELSVLKRGRNAHTNHTPKNQSKGDYHYATGLESLFGWLFLKGEENRLEELFRMICEGGEENADRENNL